MPDAPDGVKLISVGVVAGSTFIPSEAITETLVLEYNDKTTTSTDYVEVVTHTVTAGKTLILSAVEMTTDNFELTKFKLEIGGETIFEDLFTPSAYSPPIPGMKYAAGTVITLYVASDDGTQITAYGDIVGKEIG